MQRELVFEDNELGQRRFRFLYQAFLIGGIQERKLRAVVKQEATILRALRSVGEKVEATEETMRHVPMGADPLRLRPDGGRVVLDQADYELLKKYVENEQIGWRPWVAEEVQDMQDFVGAAAEVSE